MVLKFHHLVTLKIHNHESEPLVANQKVASEPVLNGHHWFSLFAHKWTTRTSCRSAFIERFGNSKYYHDWALADSDAAMVDFGHGWFTGNNKYISRISRGKC